MNANELADKLEQGHWEGGTREQAATMLRQQHSELKELKLARLADLDVILKQRAEIELLFKEIPEFEKVFSNEPIAWFEQDPDMKSIWYQCDKNSPNAIPLYTHPAKPIDKPDECISGCPENQTCDYCAGIKTLTDEEIVAVWDENCIVLDTDRTIIEFARAILRKAQEK